MTDEMGDALAALEEASEGVGEARSCEDPPELMAGHLATQSMARDRVVALLNAQPDSEPVGWAIQTRLNSKAEWTWSPVPPEPYYADAPPPLMPAGASNLRAVRIYTHPPAEAPAAEPVGDIMYVVDCVLPCALTQATAYEEASDHSDSTEMLEKFANAARLLPVIAEHLRRPLIYAHPPAGAPAARERLGIDGHEATIRGCLDGDSYNVNAARESLEVLVSLAAGTYPEAPAADMWRGHSMVEDDEGAWRYARDGVLVSEDPTRTCGRCEKPGKTEHDPCIANLPGVVNACCGHGDSSASFVVFENGVILRGFSVLVASPLPTEAPAAEPQRQLGRLWVDGKLVEIRCPCGAVHPLGTTNIDDGKYHHVTATFTGAPAAEPLPFTRSPSVMEMNQRDNPAEEP